MEGPNKETVPEELEKIKIDDIEKMEDDKTYRSPFLHIEIKDLIPEAQELYLAFERKDFVAAQGMLAELDEKIEKIKKESTKISNQQFRFWIDNKIIEGMRIQESKDAEEMDNH